MRKHRLNIEDQVNIFQILGVLVTAALCLVLTVSVTLNRKYEDQEHEILRTATTLARIDVVVDALKTGNNQGALGNYLDIYIKTIPNLDFVAVCDLNNICLYYPNKGFLGRTLNFGGEERIMAEQQPFIMSVARTGYDLELVYAPVKDRTENFIGYVILSVFHHDPADEIQNLFNVYVVVSLTSAILGIFLAVSIRGRTHKLLQGRRIEEYRRLNDERDEVLDTLDEAIVAVNLQGEVIMMNRAFLKMIGRSEEFLHYDGKLQDIFPETVLPYVMESGTAQYNISVQIHGRDYVSSRIPVYERGEMIGAASISRNVTEVRRLGQELSETNQLVDTLRSFNHEYNNKLHVILGYLEQWDTKKAKSFIMDNIGPSAVDVGKVTSEIESTGIAAIIIGKMVAASNCGIKLNLQPDSYCKNLTRGISFDCYVTVLGNLLQNAIDELQECSTKLREISLGLFIDESYTIISVTDTGRGVPETVRNYLFQKGVSTKGTGHGIGLFLVKEMVDKNHGTIELDTVENEGTCITVSFQERTIGG